MRRRWSSPRRRGFFAKHGMPDMEILKQASWGATRDNMALGAQANGIDGGHILSPKPYLYATGKVMQNNQPLPMYTLLRLERRLSGHFGFERVQGSASRHRLARALKEAFAKKKAAGKEVKAAMTFPGGTHDLWMRYWLAAGGIDPDKDISTIVVPPPQMVANMKVGNMDCFCVGEPWNEQLVNQDIGFTAATTGEIWFKHPEKVLGMRADWVDANPKATLAILMAVDGSPAVVRQAWKTRTRWPRSSASANGSTCRCPTSSAASRATSTTAAARSPRAAIC